MDLMDFNMTTLGNRGAWIDIVGPAGQTTGIRIHVRGAHSEAIAKVTKDHEQRVAEAIAKAKGRLDLEVIERDRDAAMAVASTIAWEGVTYGGKELACTPDAVRDLYLNPGFSWLAVQVYRASQDAGLFCRAAAGHRPEQAPA